MPYYKAINLNRAAKSHHSLYIYMYVCMYVCMYIYIECVVQSRLGIW